MKSQILEYIKSHEGCRKRDIADALKVWVGDIVKPIFELESDHKIYRVIYRDNAQMEFYDKWYLVK